MEYDFYKNHKITLKRDTYMSKGLSGLTNIGNKCYINSILQCLSNTIYLTDYFLSNRYKQDLTLNNRTIANLYNILISNIWIENTIIKPRSLLENIKDKYSSRSITQEDSHEFLLYFLEELHKCLLYKIEVNIKGKVVNERDSLMKDSLIKWKEFYENDYSIIIQCFYGMNFTKVICNNSKCNESIVYEPFNVISLPTTREDSNIYQCLDNYFSKNETVDNWTCEKCNNIGCNKSNAIWSLPNYLIVHLKRTDNRLNKLDNTIRFPLDDLDLTKYIEKDKKDNNNYIYSLYAVNYHSGNLKSGHYWSKCRNLDNKWYCYNDLNVSIINAEFDSEIINKNAYILFYYRKFI